MAAKSSVAKWLVGAGLAVLGASAVAGLALGGRLGVGVLPGLVGMGLAGAGAIVAFRRGEGRLWGILGVGGAVLGLTGAIVTLVSIGDVLQKAQVVPAQKVLSDICKGARYWAEEGFPSESRGVGAAPPPLHFTSGRSDPAGALCCPRERCQGRTFRGSPWSELSLEGVSVPSPWVFEIVASGAGNGASAAITATADLGCDGALTRVSSTLTIENMGVTCTPITVVIP